MSSITFMNGDSFDVYFGFWTNWSYGRVRGATLTLSRNNGSLLIAFLALFVATAGKSFWRILCFALHQTLSTPTDPRDGLYHQRQAILRNSETALQGGKQLLTSIIIWKRSRASQRVVRRSVPIIATAVVLSCGFALAGIYSSRVSNGDLNEVLLSGERCGYANRERDYGVYDLDYSPWVSYRTLENMFYARTCYQKGSDTKGCSIYIKPRLQLHSERNASCPFSDSICISKFGNLKLDSGFLDTHTDLGLNMAPTHRLQIRHTYHCAPLKTKGYSKTVNYANKDGDRSSRKLFRLFYGAYEGQSPRRPLYSNFTYQVPVNDSITHLGGVSSRTGSLPNFGLGRAAFYSGFNYSATDTFYSPIKELQVANSDVLLFFLSAPDIDFEQKIDDPWFSAHQPSGSFVKLDENGHMIESLYKKDEPATALGCTRQFQYCRVTQKPDDQRCEPPRGVRAPEFKKVALGDEKADQLAQAIEDIIMENFVPIETTVGLLGSTVLMARSSLQGPRQAKLPSNQWQIELENLVSSELATFQGQAIDTVNGPPTAAIAKIWSPFNGSIHKELCRNQKIRSTRYPSFNVLGLCLILTIGSLLILLEIFLEPIVRWVCEFISRRRSQRLDSDDEEKPSGTKSTSKPEPNVTVVQYSQESQHLKHSEWSAHSTLQLQRMAHEAIGAGTWRRTTSEIPVSLPNQPLGTLDFMNPPRSHPYLVKPVHSVGSVLEQEPAFQDSLSSVESNGGQSEQGHLGVVRVEV